MLKKGTCSNHWACGDQVSRNSPSDPFSFYLDNCTLVCASLYVNNTAWTFSPQTHVWEQAKRQGSQHVPARLSAESTRRCSESWLPMCPTAGGLGATEETSPEQVGRDRVCRGMSLHSQAASGTDVCLGWHQCVAECLHVCVCLYCTCAVPAAAAAVIAGVSMWERLWQERATRGI